MLPYIINYYLTIASEVETIKKMIQRAYEILKKNRNIADFVYKVISTVVLRSLDFEQTDHKLSEIISMFGVTILKKIDLETDM